MCGIIGVTSFFNKCDHLKFIEATRLIKHRGPDEEGFLFLDDISFGHERLSIIDKENGKQPMSYLNYHLVYNGEIYNTDELKKDLESKGFTFDSYSDTEILLKALICYKEEALKRINGIFAFGFYDGKKLLIARDRLGVKPLYYSVFNNDIIFASEIKSILKYLNINKITMDGLKEILGMGPSQSLTITPFKNIYKLNPGEMIYYDKSIRKDYYWHLEKKDFHLSYEETVKRTRELVLEAITSEIKTDVPLGTFLSGGLDSSIITSVLAKKMGKIDTFTIDYEGNDVLVKDNFLVSNDLDYIGYIQKMYDINNYKIKINLDDLVNSLDDVLFLRDYPGMVDIDSSLYLFGREIKKTHTVLLSGECADEIFGGYPWFYRDDGNEYAFPWLRNIDIKESLLKEDVKNELKLKEYLEKRYLESITDSKEHTMSLLNINYFMANLLERKDRMTMASGLEVRVPFADYRLVEFMYNVPFSYKFHNNVEKGLLRDAFKDYLPREIYERKKSPYPKTTNKKYDILVKEKLKKSLSNPNSILLKLFDLNKIESLIEVEEVQLPWYGQLLKHPQLLAYLYQIDRWFIEYNLEIE